MKNTILIFSFLIFCNSLGLAQTKKILITIPSYSCIDDSGYTSRKKREIRTELNEINISRYKDFPEQNIFTEEYKRLLFKSDQLDLVQLTLLVVMPKAILENLYSILRKDYSSREEFLNAYDFLITEKNKKTKKLRKKYNADFKIDFDYLKLTNKDSLEYKIKVKPKKGKSLTIKNKIQFLPRKTDHWVSDLHDLYQNILWEVIFKIVESDPNMKKRELIYGKRIKKLKNNNPTTKYIPQDLKLKIESEASVLNQFRFNSGMINKDTTIFKGVYHRVFSDSTITYKDFILKTKGRPEHRYGKEIFPIGTVSYFIEGLKYDGFWYFTISRCSSHIKVDKFDKTVKTKKPNYCDLLGSLFNNDYFMEESDEVNPDYLENLYYIKNLDQNGIPKIIQEYQKQKKRKFNYD